MFHNGLFLIIQAHILQFQDFILYRAWTCELRMYFMEIHGPESHAFPLVFFNSPELLWRVNPSDLSLLHIDNTIHNIHQIIESMFRN